MKVRFVYCRQSWLVQSTLWTFKAQWECKTLPESFKLKNDFNTKWATGSAAVIKWFNFKKKQFEKSRQYQSKQFNKCFLFYIFRTMWISILGDGPLSTSMELVNLHPTKGTHWVAYIKQKFLDSYGGAPPEKLSKLHIKRNGSCLQSECKLKVSNIKKIFIAELGLLM